MAVLLVIIISSVSFGLLLYGLFSPAESETKQRAGKKEGKGYKEPGEGAGLKLEETVSSLTAELEKAKADYINIENELGRLKEKEVGFNEELTKREVWVAKSEESLNKIKERNLELEKKFQDKEKELQEEFTKNVDLIRDLRELNEKHKLLEKEDKTKASEIEKMKHKIDKLLKETKDQLATIAAFKKQEEEKEWVPKSEFNKLNEEYTELEKELEAQEEKVAKLNEEIVRLRILLREQEPQEKQGAGQQPPAEPKQLEEKLPEQLPPAQEKKEGSVQKIPQEPIPQEKPEAEEAVTKEEERAKKRGEEKNSGIA